MQYIKILFVSMFLFFVICAFPQKPGKAPYFKSFNVQKLSHALTDPFPDDSLKVRSIYLWITHHIRYGINDYRSGGNGNLDCRRILLTRKAICMGYSLLFDSLCAVAGLDARMVIGYVRNPWYMKRDTFFLDNHAWNSVNVNGEWKLIDNTWATGKIIQKKQYLRRLLSILFGIPYRVKYKFVHKNNDYYFMIPPDSLIKTHLPATPAWQLLPCSVPIDTFQYSPESVTRFLENPPAGCFGHGELINEIIEAEAPLEYLVSGNQALDLNPSNHQDKTYGYYVLSRNLFYKGNYETDLKQRIASFDSAVKQFDSTAMYYKHTARDARDEGRFLLRRTERIHKKEMSMNKFLSRELKQMEKEVNRERSSVKFLIVKLKSASRKMNPVKYKVRNFQLRKPSRGAEKMDDNQVKILMEKVRENKNRIKMLQERTGNFCLHLREPDQQEFMDQLNKRDSVLNDFMERQKMVNFYRWFGLCIEDDFLRSHRDSMVRKLNAVTGFDSILQPASRWEAGKNALFFRNSIDSASKTVLDNLLLYDKLKKMDPGSLLPDSLAKAEKQAFLPWIDSVKAENDLLVKHLEQYRKKLLEYRKNIKVSLRHSHLELKLIKMFYTGYKIYFRWYYGRVQRMFNRNIGRNNHMKNKARLRKLRAERDLKALEKKESALEKGK